MKVSKSPCFAHVLSENHAQKPSLDGDQYGLTVKQVSTFCAFPAVKNVEKHSVFQCLRKTGPKLGPMLGGGGTPKSVLLEPAGPLWADTYGGKKVGGAGGHPCAEG